MSIGGTKAHVAIRRELPSLVARATLAAEDTAFELSCTPGQGQLLRAIANGVPAGGVIGETGTGCGVGLAWMAVGAGPDVRLVSVERDVARAETARAVFAGEPRVEIIADHWKALDAEGPFDLLVLDGGGAGKDGNKPIDPVHWLKLGGTLVVDDFTPWTSWPPYFEGEPDHARLHWLEHPALLATEVRVGADVSTVVAVRRH